MKDRYYKHTHPYHPPTHTHIYTTGCLCEFQRAFFSGFVVSLKTESQHEICADKHPYKISHVGMRRFEKPIFAENISDVSDGSLS